jgi:hypothetical protein
VVSIAGIAVALAQKNRGASLAIVLAAIFLALGTLSTPLLLLLFLTNKWASWWDGVALMVPPMLGLTLPPTGWLLLAIKSRAARV